MFTAASSLLGAAVTQVTLTGLWAAGIASASAGPVPVHWNAPDGTWVRTTSSTPASPGAPVRLPSGSAPAQASAAASGAGSVLSSIRGSADNSVCLHCDF